ncbi:MAG: ABC transporter ATP-binding protein [Betaproteobacteria bacterium]|nr:ABC transporter ATP-binding protein [Betaproteobacteria bacterium]
MSNEILSLQINDALFSYPGTPSVLAGLSLRVGLGERVAVLGQSGIGKSSLLRLIAGLEKLSGGEIWIHGEKVSSAQLHVPPEKRRVGMVFQDWAVFPHLTVFENIAFGLQRRGKDVSERSRVGELLTEFELQGLESRMPSTLSGGQLQRVACARALAPKPEILLLDEAFSSLDVSLRQRVRQQVVGALKLEKATSILVTHDLDEAREFADRVFELRHGCLHDASVVSAG